MCPSGSQFPRELHSIEASRVRSVRCWKLRSQFPRELHFIEATAGTGQRRRTRSQFLRELHFIEAAPHLVGRPVHEVAVPSGTALH